MGEPTRGWGRDERSSAVAAASPDRAVPAATEHRTARRRVVRYGLRALVLAGVAGAAWLVGSQVANASPAHDADTPAPACRSGLLPATTHAVGSTLHNLTSGGTAAGDKTCDRPSAGSHHGNVPPRTAPVATSTCSAGTAGHRAASAAASTSRQADSACTRPTRTSTDSATTPSGTAAAGDSGPAPRGQLADATSPVLGPVADVTRPVTGPVTNAVRPMTGVLNQSPAIGALTDVVRPVTSTVATTARPVTGTLTGPLVSATRPVTGLLGAVAHPLPGVTDGVTTPVTGVLTGVTGPLSGSLVPSLAAPHQASWLGQYLPAGGLVRPARPALDCAAHSSATWAGEQATSPGFRSLDADHSAPGFPGPAPFGTGATTGGAGVSAASHAHGGAFAPTGPYAAIVTGAQRVRPNAAQIGLPRLSEADPVVSPD